MLTRCLRSPSLRHVGGCRLSMPGLIASCRKASSVPFNKHFIRFKADDGEEYFGVYADVTESSAYIAERNEMGKLAISSTRKHIEVILPPVDPPAIFCVGLNYADHAAEVYTFLTKTFYHGKHQMINCSIIVPKVARDPPEVDYEAELAVVIGQECRNVSESEAMDYVLGYTIANDVTARRWQGKKGGGQWIRSKCFDTFLPLGPFLVPKSEIKDVQNLGIRTWVNEMLVQDSNTSQMVNSVAQLISFISEGTTLLPGSVILTGTPAGVGYVKNNYLRSGDTVRIEIEGLGVLRNVVAEELA